MNGTEDNEIGILISLLIILALVMISFPRIADLLFNSKSPAEMIQSLIPCIVEK